MPIPADVATIIRDFNGRQGAGMGYDVAFPKIERASLAKQLRDRVMDPSLINQAGASLCAPAVLLYCLAKKKPKQYVNYVIDLYEKGVSSIGEIKVKPGEDCRTFDMNTVKILRNRVPDVDWIALAGLRDSENVFLDYDEVSDQIAGITLPGELAKWFNKGGFSNIINKTSLVNDKELYTLLEANKQYLAGESVCLFIGSKLLKGGGFPGNATADHWVVLTSPVLIDGQPVLNLLQKGKAVNDDDSLLSRPIQFSVYTWQTERYDIGKYYQNLTVEKFLDYFYGFISAR